MSLKIESARLLTWKAAVLKDSGLQSTKNSSMAKWAASECSNFVTHNCIQILGGMGFVNDMPAERFYRFVCIYIFLNSFLILNFIETPE